MGVYMTKPVKDKISSDCENAKLKCGASSMQGWRVSQEDAHNCCLEFDEKLSLFAVYDGHGGHEVAQYASQELPNFLKSLESYKNGDFTTALKDSFLGFDATLRDNEVVEKLRKMAKDGKEKQDTAATEDEDDSYVVEDEIDLQSLKNEADMPLNEVLFANYTGIAKTPSVMRRLSLGEFSKSPYLRGKATTNDEVSSSSCQVNSVTNGVSEANGDCQEKMHKESEATESSEAMPSTVSNGEVVDSTSSDNSGNKSEVETSEECNSSKKIEDEEEDKVVSSTGDRLSKKKAAQIVYKSILSGFDSSDSDDSDASFETDNKGWSTKGSLADDDTDDELDEKDEGEDEEDDEEEDEEDDEEEDSIKGNEEPGMDSGCTAVVALVSDGKLYVANAGDSRAVLSRNGIAIDMSIDHKPEDEPELQRIEAAGGDVTGDGRVNGGLNLSRALGDHLYKRAKELDATQQMITALPDVKVEDIKEEDEFLVLACDGIWNSMSSQEVVDFVRPLMAKGEKLSSICETLFEKCLAPDTGGDGTGCDNMTCVLVQFLPNRIKMDTNSNSPVKEVVQNNEGDKPQESLKRTADDSLEEVHTTVTQSTKKPRVDTT
ncbi:probable protein phosphatase 2C 11 isoform X2 [Cimex lectularius]|uniref:protein-serine/threonine phosphatase n=1 Tax=Cimex lectularius TaxID=79782 RepID=A0A8I6RJS9_CIMLE|nr:probable protein phosphatase 2C 11 isoform X2 [Cimex lectularius]